MRRAAVHNDGRLAGILEETPAGYRFTYDEEYLRDPSATAISLTLLKRAAPHESPTLFSFFYGLLAEGTTMTLQCRKLKIDEDDHFGRLIKTANSDVIGSVTVEELAG